MIKLQLLLRMPCAQPGVSPALAAALGKLGMAITGTGRASVSVQMDDTDFTDCFGRLTPGDPGLGGCDAADLSVPSALADSISLVTLAPRHCVPDNPTR